MRRQLLSQAVERLPVDRGCGINREIHTRIRGKILHKVAVIGNVVCLATETQPLAAGFVGKRGQDPHRQLGRNSAVAKLCIARLYVGQPFVPRVDNVILHACVIASAECEIRCVRQAVARGKQHIQIAARTSNLCAQPHLAEHEHREHHPLVFRCTVNVSPGKRPRQLQHAPVVELQHLTHPAHVGHQCFDRQGGQLPPKVGNSLFRHSGKMQPADFVTPLHPDDRAEKLCLGQRWSRRLDRFLPGRYICRGRQGVGRHRWHNGNIGDRLRLIAGNRCHHRVVDRRLWHRAEAAFLPVQVEALPLLFEKRSVCPVERIAERHHLVPFCFTKLRHLPQLRLAELLKTAPALPRLRKHRPRNHGHAASHQNFNLHHNHHKLRQAPHRPDILTI